MNINEYVELINRFQNQIAPTLKSVAIAQRQISKSLEPIKDMQYKINNSFKPIYQILEQYKNISMPDCQQYVSIIQRQQDIMSKLSTLNFDISKTQLSSESSVSIAQVSSTLINEFNDLPEEFNESKETALELSNQNNSFTWQQFLFIISFIITVISFVQNQKPDEQDIETNKKLQQSIEIQTKQLDYLEDISNSLHQLIQIESKELDLLKQDNLDT